jgi:hypothetical protein
MRSLTYISTSHAGFDTHLACLLPAARRRNDLLDVTGMLLFSGGNIIHTIEGPDRWVGMLFDLFAQDQRNWNVQVMLDRPIEDRTFPDWTMGFRRRHAPGILPAGFTPFLHERVPAVPYPRCGSDDPALCLHRLFHETMR